MLLQSCSEKTRWMRSVFYSGGQHCVSWSLTKGKKKKHSDWLKKKKEKKKAFASIEWNTVGYDFGLFQWYSWETFHHRNGSWDWDVYCPMVSLTGAACLSVTQPSVLVDFYLWSVTNQITLYTDVPDLEWSVYLQVYLHYSVINLS